MARHVDNPGEVYGRRDAADYAAADGGVQVLNEPGLVGPTTGRTRAPAPPEPRRSLIYGPGRFPDVLAYRRMCPACDVFMEPLIYDVDDEDEEAIRLFHSPNDWIYLRGPRWEQECSSCRAAIVGVVHVPMLDPTTAVPGWTFELRTAFARVRSTVSRLALDRNGGIVDQMAYVAETWASMERDLGRFEREWRGRLNPSPAVIAPRLGGQLRGVSPS
jgi:hypothetical protein